MKIGDTFNVAGAKYTVLTVESNSVTALVNGTPATNLGDEIVISDTKSISGMTYRMSKSHRRDKI